MLTSFSDLGKKVNVARTKKRVLVVAPHDEHTLESVNDAYVKGIMDPVLIGDGDKISKIIGEKGLALDDVGIVESLHDAECARTAARMVASGDGDAIMKGKIQTSDLLREVVNKEYGLLTGEIMSHVGLFQIPSYHKLLVLTDGGMVVAPDAEQKRHILDNAVRVVSSLGVRLPKVAVLCATEIENPQIQASVDAALLKSWNEEGRINDCVVEGPISFDLMYDRESAKIKGYKSPVAGDADILLMPDMTAGNLVAKSFMLAAGGMMAGLIVGAKAPIILVSRGASADEKYWSLVFAAAV